MAKNRNGGQVERNLLNKFNRADNFPRGPQQKDQRPFFGAALEFITGTASGKERRWK